MTSVHWAIVHRVKADALPAFELKLQDFAQRSMGVTGMAGIHILHPPAGSTSTEVGILRSFESESDARHFYASRLFVDWKAEIADLIEAEPTYHRLNGLEAFFQSGGHRMPPRWKMAIVTFLGVLPTVLIWANLLGPVLAGTHWLLASSVINAAVVTSLTWVVMPLLTKLFRSWL